MPGLLYRMAPREKFTACVRAVTGLALLGDASVANPGIPRSELVVGWLPRLRVRTGDAHRLRRFLMTLVRMLRMGQAVAQPVEDNATGPSSVSEAVVLARTTQERASEMTDLRDDRAVLQRVFEGDLDAFELLVDRYGTRLFGYLCSRIRDDQVAEDLTQETFLRAFWAARRGVFDSDSRCCKAWIFKIASNCLKDYLRGRIHRPTPVQLGTDSHAGDERADLAKRVVADTPDPADAAMEDERRQGLYRLLDRIPEDQAEAVRLKVLGDLTFAEIAAKLDCPVATVKSRLRYGLAKLHELMTSTGDSAA